MRIPSLPAIAITLPLLHLAGCGEAPEGEYRTVTSTDAAAGTEGVASQDEIDPEGDSRLTHEAPKSPDEDPADEAGATKTAEGETTVGTNDGNVTLVGANVPDPEERTPEEVDPGEGARSRIEPLVPEPEFRREKSGALRVTFDDLDLKRIIGIERPTADTPRDLPTWLHDLAGQRIRIRGFMKPSEYTSGLTGFTFVRDNGVCCFGPKAKLYDMIRVRLREGTSTDFIQNVPIDVEGVFRIEPTEFLDELLFFYHLEDAEVVRR